MGECRLKNWKIYSPSKDQLTFLLNESEYQKKIATGNPMHTCAHTHPHTPTHTHAHTNKLKGLELIESENMLLVKIQ